MKKTLIIIFIVLVCLAIIWGAYKTFFNTEGCNTNQDCVDSGIICNREGEVPVCEKENPSSGEIYDEPQCICINPYLLY